MTGLRVAGLHSILPPVNRPFIMSEARSSLQGSSCPLAALQDLLLPQLNVLNKIYYTKKIKTYENLLANHIQQEDAAPMNYKRIKRWTQKKKISVGTQRNACVNGGREARPDTLITPPTRQPSQTPAATVNNDQRRPNAALMPWPQDGAASFSHLKKIIISLLKGELDSHAPSIFSKLAPVSEVGSECWKGYKSDWLGVWGSKCTNKVRAGRNMCWLPATLAAGSGTDIPVVTITRRVRIPGVKGVCSKGGVTGSQSPARLSGLVKPFIELIFFFVTWNRLAFASVFLLSSCE